MLPTPKISGHFIAKTVFPVLCNNCTSSSRQQIFWCCQMCDVPFMAGILYRKQSSSSVPGCIKGILDLLDDRETVRCALFSNGKLQDRAARILPVAALK